MMQRSFFKPASRPLSALAAAALALAFIIPAWIVILSGVENERGAFDQNLYHLKAIEGFAAQWPRFDFRDYGSATTPGYHVLLAGVHRFAEAEGGCVMGLRLAGSLFTVGLLFTLGWVAARRVGALPALALGAPLVASLYVFAAGVWLLPDNLAWWGVLAVLLIALHPRVDVRILAAGAVVLVGLVLVRQIHLWAAGLIWLSAWLGSGPNVSAVWPLDLRQRLGRTAWALLATVPALAVVGYFVWLWGGVVPPMFQETGAEAGGGHDVRGINAATPALILALVGIFATFYAGLLWPVLRGGLLATARSRLTVVVAAALGLLIGILPSTTYSLEAGRWSGLWNIVRYLDMREFSYAERSPLIVGLAVLGGVWLALWALALNARDRWIFLGAWVAFIVAQSTTHFAWQRYHEPFILIMLAIFATRLPGTGAGGWARSMQPPVWAVGAWAGPVVLAAMLAAVTVLSLR